MKDQKFKMKDLGPIHYVLGPGISVTISIESLTTNQLNYIAHTLTKYRMFNCNPDSTQMATKMNLCTGDGSKPANKSIYQSLVGSFIYQLQLILI